jgi:hypothetical protein
MHILRWSMGKGCSWLVVAVLLGLLGLARPVDAAEFSCAAGDVACLISAMHAVNASWTASTIVLAAGRYALTAVDNDTDGPTGLPSITSRLTLRRAGAASTVLERAVGAPQFRLLHVAPQATLALEGLTLQGGDLAGLPDGGAFGTVARSRSLTASCVSIRRAAEAASTIPPPRRSRTAP